MKIGIDRISFDTSRYFLDLATLADARGIDVAKYHEGLGQYKMSVPAPGEDIVTMAANAAQRILASEDKKNIDTVLFATESGIDQSKAAGVYIQSLLDLPKNCRVLELKQACYSGVGALQLALSYVARYPEKKVLLLCSDISRYGLKTNAESSQGCAAVAMLIARDPKIIAIEPEAGIYTEDVMDFWRPNYRDEAIVEGKVSTIVYMRALEEAWLDYQNKSGRNVGSHDYFCYHTPVPRLVEKAHKILSNKVGGGSLSEEALNKQIQSGLNYGREIGNSYTAALFVSLLSLLDLEKEDLSAKRIGFYSYGSGCVAEYFSGVVQNNYRDYLLSDVHKLLIEGRKKLEQSSYEKFYQFALPEDGSDFDVPKYDTGLHRLTKMSQHKRIYEKV